MGRECEIFGVTGGRKCGRVILLGSVWQMEAEKRKLDVAVQLLSIGYMEENLNFYSLELF